MERSLNFEGVTSHLIVEAKQSNDQVDKNIIYASNSVKKMNLLVLSGIQRQSHYDMSHSFNKYIIICMVFVTYKYLNVEIKRLKIISA